MRVIEEMLSTHPDAAASAELVACIAACHECTASCTLCADSCLAEEEVGHLRRCIRLNLDCADICAVTAAVLSRQTAAEASVVRAQLEACLRVCEACAEECGGHAEHHEHCRVCAERCRRCADACRALLGSLSA